MLVTMTLGKVLRIIVLGKAADLGKIKHERILEIIQFDVDQKIKHKKLGITGMVVSFTTDGMINWKPDSNSIATFCDPPNDLEIVVEQPFPSTSFVYHDGSEDTH